VSIRILLIEDEENIADSLLMGLREEGYTVEHAADGVAGWDRLQRETWNVVLLDWWLPGHDGVELLRRFRERDRKTPVLLLTARDQVECRVLGLDSGADDYLCKPFDVTELLARIRALIRRREETGSDILSLGDVRVDLGELGADRGGKPLDLSAKELALLIFFLRNPGRLLTRPEIYERVWKEPYDPASNTLGVHIMELRRKLEAHGGRLIHTVRGQGFVFAESPVAGAEAPQ
jgi:two-component system, OmpR family, copper resistance phosphate regulon response regulator CusR